MTAEKKISVIIPSYNSCLTIESTLKAIDDQTRRDLVSEVIVIDSSDDGKTREILSEYESGAMKVVQMEHKTMPAVSRNVGVDYATGDILVFIDADAYLASDCIEKIVEGYNKGYMAGGGGIAIPPFQKNKKIAIAQYYLQFNEYISAGKDRVKRFVLSCNMFCDKELFNEAGGFPEMRAAEDVSFGLEISKLTDLWFVPGAKVYHIFREDRKAVMKNQILLGKYVYKYRKKHNNFICRGVLPLVFLPAILLIKTVRIGMRILEAGYSHFFRFTIIMPVFFCCLLFWSIGFVRGWREEL